jgi:hypothetical protein
LFLKLIIYVLFAFVVARLARNLFGRVTARPRQRPNRLDPGQAVDASWTEVSDEEGEGTAER